MTAYPQKKALRTTPTKAGSRLKSFWIEGMQTERTALST
jgi:hypothetical protein